MPQPRLPSPDDWRAVSILMVLGAHSTFVFGFPATLRTVFYWAFDGDLGVRVFFIISGLLITWLLLVESDRTGRVNLRHLYVRRALRILPVYWVFLSVLALLQLLTPSGQSASVWVGNVTFTTNYVSGGAPGPSGHLWSLAVEEQFYLLWPGIFFIFALAKNIRNCAWVLIVPVLLAPAVRVISYLRIAPPPLSRFLSHHSFFGYFDSLAIGCACAVLLAGRPGAVRRWFEKHARMVVLGALSLVLFPYILTKALILGTISIPFGPTLQGVGIALLLLHSVLFPDLGSYRVLNWDLICQIGVLSYSIYIWQQLFCTKPAVFGWGTVWWKSFPTWLIAVGIAAVVSYYGLERPLFRLRAHLRD